MNYKKLQHLSDIRGIYKNDGSDNENFLNSDKISKIISSFIFWLTEKNYLPISSLSIVIGNDTRKTSEEIKNIVINTLSVLECNIFDCGIIPTPALQYYIIDENQNIDAGIMITASHLPEEYNGFKFFTKKGSIEIDDLSIIIEKAVSITINKSKNNPKLSKVNIFDSYKNRIANYLKNKINDHSNFEKPLTGLKIIVDASNGTASFFPQLLNDLGADASNSYNIENSNLNLLSNSFNEIALKSLKDKLLKNNAHLGIIFDADMDKAFFVNPGEPEISGNCLVAVVSAIILEEYPKSTIVTDSITSDAITEFIHNSKGFHHRFKRGYRRIINEAKRLNKDNIDCMVAIETSGHSAFYENNFIDDAAFLASKLIVKLAQNKNSNLNIFQKYTQGLILPKINKEYRLKINAPNYDKESAKIMITVKNFCENVPGWKVNLNNFEGVRISANKYFGDGWMHIRLSLHEQCLVIHTESNSENGLKMLISRIYKLLSKFNTIDTSPLTN
jgi:phosphoglucomutase